MTAVTKLEAREQTAVARRVEDNHEALRERNAMIAIIRGQSWGLSIDSRMAKAVSHYCLSAGLDPARHVEVLGNRIYLTAEFYEERGAPLLKAGIVRKAHPDFINIDPRLEQLSSNPDPETREWAKTEIIRRTKARIAHNAPDEAKAIAVQTLTIVASGVEIIGVNWCGGGTRKKMKAGGVVVDGDPIGDLEPTKTALTRASRRAWKQVAEVIPDYGAAIQPAEKQARLLNAELNPDNEVVGEPAHRPTLTQESAESVMGAPAAERVVPRGPVHDPYGESGEPAGAPLADPQPSENIDDNRSAICLPNWRAHRLAGKPIAEVERSDLEIIFSQLSEAADKGDTEHKELIAQIALELDERRNS